MWEAALSSLCLRGVSETVGVVLAGGSSKRFGRPKQRMPVGGVPLVRRIADSLSSCLSMVYVSAASPLDAAELSALTGGRPSLVDEELPCSGPPRAMATASSLGYRYVAFAPSDMPGLTPLIVAGLIHLAFTRGNAPVSIVAWGNGRLEFLLGVYDSSVLKRLRESCRVKAGVLRTRAGDAARLASALRLLPVEALSRDPRSLSHITHRGDEYSPRPRGRHGSLYSPVLMANRGSSLYSRALAYLSRGELREAYRCLVAEHEAHVSSGLLHLAAQAASDAARLAGLIGGDSQALWRRVKAIYRFLEREAR